MAPVDAFPARSLNELVQAKQAADRLPELQDGGITGWDWLGPGNIGGRIRSILIHPTVPDKMWIGSVVGGIWLSKDGGGTWTPVDDFMANLAVTTMVMDPANPDVMYAGTGEGFLVSSTRLDGSPGAGVFKSSDGGEKWVQMPSTAAWADDEDDRYVNRLAIKRNGSNVTILAATNGGIYRSLNGSPFTKVRDGWVTDVKFSQDLAVAGLMTFCSSSRCGTTTPDQTIVSAIYSGDGGLTWTASQFGDTAPAVLTKAYVMGEDSLLLDTARPFQTYDIVRVGDSPGEIVQVRGRRNANQTLPLLNPGTLSNNYAVGTPVRLLPSQRTELAVHEADRRVVFASMGAGGGTIWKSTDGGKTFVFMGNSNHDYLHNGNSSVNTRAFYAQTIWVSPDDQDLLVVGGSELFRSTNGGKTLEPISNGRYVLPAFGQRSPHGDHHVIVEHPSYGPGNRTVFFGNDGGLHKAVDIETVGPEAPENSGWVNLNWNLGITQFYGGAATISPSVQWFMGGGQDNGRPHLRVDGGSAPNVNGWVLPFDADVTDNVGGKGDDLYQVAIDATDPEHPVFYAAQVQPRIWKSTDAGSTWTKMWEPFCASPPNPCLCSICVPAEAGRNLAPFNLDPSNTNILVAGAQRIWRSMDAAVNFEPIRDFEPGSPRPLASAIDIAPSDPETYWVGFDSGALSYTHNGSDPAASVSWVDVGGSPLPSRTVTDIAINPANRDEVFVTFELPDVGDPLDTVWYTNNGGDCWELRVGTPPYELPRVRILTVRIDPSDPDRIYLGTDLGVLASDDRGLTWNRMALHAEDEGPANVEVWELFWQGDYLVAATNGRGMFRTLPTSRPELFKDKAASSGADDPGNSEGVAWGDYDGDGDLDLYVASFSGQVNHLYRNEGDGTFFDVSALSGTDDAGNGTGVAWGDYDGDGGLDLYLANSSTANRLFRNNHDGTFTDVAAVAGTDDSGSGRAVAWVDFDNDGTLDLYVVNVGANKLYRNEGSSVFTDVSSLSGTDDPGSGQGAAWGDYDGDGDQDLYVANWSGQANKLYRNEGGGAFVDVSTASGVAGSAASAGVAWGDYENDGDLDLYVANEGPNSLYRNDGSLPFVDVAAESGTDDGGIGRGVAWGDYDNDGDLDLYVTNFTGPNRLLRFEFCGRFTDLSGISGTDDGAASRNGVWGDFGEDGKLDLYVANAGANRLYLNAGGAPDEHHWLQVDLVGEVSNRNGIGARIRVVADGQAQMREVSGGSGLYAQNSLTVEFGFGWSAVAESLEVLWPSGKRHVFIGVPLDRRTVIFEDCNGNCITDAGVTDDPQRFALYANRPNPFERTTMIHYDLPRPSRVSLTVYDIAGRMVRVLEHGIERTAGRHRAHWQGRDESGRKVSPGVYLYALEAGNHRAVRKMVLLE